jgi:hypothetical protein
MRTKNITKENMEMLQLSLEELEKVAGGVSVDCGIICASPDEKPPHPYFP